MSKTSKQPVALYIVPTPIGNMDDITLRAIEILKNVDVIMCEDTRVTNTLANHYHIQTNLRCYNDFSTPKDRDSILQLLGNGQSVALVSDAGTPLISDPGYKLVREAIARGYDVVSIPGPSSVLVALTLAGLPTDRFMFEGFLPNRSQARQNRLKALQGLDVTVVFFEAARRLPEAMQDMATVLGNRQAAVLRELTKKFEEVKRGSLSELAEYYQQHGAPRGEVVIVVEGIAKEAEEDRQAKMEEYLLKALETFSVKEAAAMVAELTGVKKKEVYAKALELMGKK